MGSLFAQELTDEQLEKLLSKLDNMERMITEDKDKSLKRAVLAFRDASSSEQEATDLYVRCIEELQFRRNDAKQFAIQQWKKNHKDKLKSEHFRAQLVTQAKYLYLMMQWAEASDEEEREEIVYKLENYIDGTISLVSRLGPSDPRGGEEDGLKKSLQTPILNSVFAKAYELDRSLRDVKNWTPEPFKYRAMYSNTIFPCYRENHPPEKFEEIWDKRISNETMLAKALYSKADYGNFLHRAVPEMKYNKWKQVFEMGNEVTGAGGMLKVLEESKGHPLLPKWYESLRALLQ